MARQNLDPVSQIKKDLENDDPRLPCETSDPDDTYETRMRRFGRCLRENEKHQIREIFDDHGFHQVNFEEKGQGTLVIALRNKLIKSMPAV